MDIENKVKKILVKELEKYAKKLCYSKNAITAVDAANSYNYLLDFIRKIDKNYVFQLQK